MGKKQNSETFPLMVADRWKAFHNVKQLLLLNDGGFVHIQLYQSVPAVLVEIRDGTHFGWTLENAKLFPLRKSKGKHKKKWANPRKLALRIDEWIFDRAFKQFRLDVHET